MRRLEPWIPSLQARRRAKPIRILRVEGALTRLREGTGANLDVMTREFTALGNAVDHEFQERKERTEKQEAQKYLAVADSERGIQSLYRLRSSSGGRA